MANVLGREESQQHHPVKEASTIFFVYNTLGKGIRDSLSHRHVCRTRICHAVGQVEERHGEFADQSLLF